MPRTERISLVTSFSAAGAELYGKRCVESIRTHWPHPLVVYGDVPMSFRDVTCRLTGDIPDWPQTRDRLPSMRGDAPKPTNYSWDAKRFAVKPFVWHDAAEWLEKGILVWLDGDTVTTADVPNGLIRSVMADVDVAYLGRGSMHPENGFVAFRLPEAMPLLAWCVDAYRLGRFTSLADGWTDCHVLRAGLMNTPVRARDLTSHTYNGLWRSHVDAFGLSPIGPYVEHFKGPGRKREHAA